MLGKRKGTTTTTKTDVTLQSLILEGIVTNVAFALKTRTKIITATDFKKQLIGVYMSILTCFPLFPVKLSRRNQTRKQCIILSNGMILYTTNCLVGISMNILERKVVS